MNNRFSFKFFWGALGALFLFVTHFSAVFADAAFPTGRGRGNQQQEVDRSLIFADGADTPEGLEKTTRLCIGMNNNNYFEIALWDKQEKKYDNRVFVSLTQSDFERQTQGTNRSQPQDVNMRDKLGRNIVELRAVGARDNPEEPCVGIVGLDINLQKSLFWDFGATPEENPAEVSFSAKADQFRSDFARAGAFTRGEEPLQRRNLLISDTANLFPVLSSGSRQGAYFVQYTVVATGKRSDNTDDTESRTFELYIVYTNNRQDFPSDKQEDYDRKEKILIDAFGAVQNGLTPNGYLQEAAWRTFGVPFTPAPAASSCGRRDVNQDGVVNIIDLTTVARRFGQRNPRIAGNTVPWSPEDVNVDDVVNIIDLVTVAQRFGQRCDSAAYSPEEPRRVVFVPVPIAKQPQNLGFASVLKSIFWVLGNR